MFQPFSPSPVENFKKVHTDQKIDIFGNKRQSLPPVLKHSLKPGELELPENMTQSMLEDPFNQLNSPHSLRNNHDRRI
jgi:hypothetical protein